MIRFHDLRMWAFIALLTLGVATPLVSGAATSPSQLVLAVAPSSTAQSGYPLASQPAIDIEDSDGNLVTSASGTVSASIQPSEQGTTLVNDTADVVGGVATFNGLTIDALSGSYTIMFAYGSLTLSSGPVVVTGGVCAGCTVFHPVTSYSPTFGPFADGSSLLNTGTLSQLRGLIKWMQREMKPGFSSTRKLTVRVYGFSAKNETAEPEILALERAEVVKSWIEPRIRGIDQSSMPVRYLVSREVSRPGSAISRKVEIILRLSA